MAGRGVEGEAYRGHAGWTCKEQVVPVDYMIHSYAAVVAVCVRLGETHSGKKWQEIKQLNC